MRHQNSVFHTVLKHVPWHVFDRLVAAHGADARVRRLSTRDQFIALLYGQLAGAQSLREIFFVQRASFRSFFGYKNHVNVDRTHKLIRRYAVTDAAVHDSRKLNGLLHQGNTSHDVFGDSAYRSAANEATLKGRGFRSRIHVRAARGHPLSKAQAAANRAKSRIRARIEHVFGAQEIAPGGRLLRTIGIVRARAKIGLQNLAYNVRRLATFERRRSHASFNLASRLVAA